MTVFKGVGAGKTKCASCRQKMGQNVTPFTPEGNLPPVAGKLSENCNKRSTFSRGAHPLFQAGGIGRAGRGRGVAWSGKRPGAASGRLPQGQRNDVCCDCAGRNTCALAPGPGEWPAIHGALGANPEGVQRAAARVQEDGKVHKKGAPQCLGSPVTAKKPRKITP